MNIRSIAIATILAGGMALAFPSGPAGATPESPSGVHLGPGSALWLNGTSNVHDFEGRTSTLIVRVSGDSTQHAPSTPAELEAYLRSTGVRSLEVEVPTNSLRSGKAGLDKNMWSDLEADKHPAIQFHLAHYSVAPRENPGDTLVVHMDGVLKIAGHERPVMLTARGVRGDNGIWFEGTYGLLMTDFGIKPRTMMLGTLRVRNAITVHYRLLLVPGAH